jgi:hypothetical protein
LLNHPKASQLLGAMFGGMGMDENGAPGEEEAEQQAEKPAPAPSKPEPKPQEAPKPDPKANLTESQRQAEREKELGNECYKKKDFDIALTHYEKAIELEPTNITYMTNKAGIL